MDGGLGDLGSSGQLGDAESGLAERELGVEKGVPGQDGGWSVRVRGRNYGEGGWSLPGVAVGVGSEGESNGD